MTKTAFKVLALCLGFSGMVYANAWADSSSCCMLKNGGSADKTECAMKCAAKGKSCPKTNFIPANQKLHPKA